MLVSFVDLVRCLGLRHIRYRCLRSLPPTVVYAEEEEEEKEEEKEEKEEAKEE